MKKLLFASLIALSSVSAYAQEVVPSPSPTATVTADATPSPTPSNQDKIRELQEQLAIAKLKAELAAANASPIPVATPTPTPAPTPAVVINVTTTQTVQTPPAPPAPPAPTVPTVVIPEKPTFVYDENQYNFILSIIASVNNHDWSSLAPFIANGYVNYFSTRYATLAEVRREMVRDAEHYGVWHATYYPDSFTRQVSSEYSPHWVGPMIYDEINAYVEVDEPGVRVHRATERITVGYTNVNGNLQIYAIVMHVI
jgi:hypothetical protein